MYNGVSITARVDQIELRSVMERLGGVERKARVAIRNAANATAVRARRLLADEARSRYTVKLGGFNAHMKLTRATLATLTALLRADGRPLTLPRFHISVSASNGVSAEQRKGSGLHPLIKNGIKSFVARGTGSGASIVLQRRAEGAANRNNLRAHVGSGVPKMIEMVYRGGQITNAGLKFRISNAFYRNLDREVARMLS